MKLTFLILICLFFSCNTEKVHIPNIEVSLDVKPYVDPFPGLKFKRLDFKTLKWTEVTEEERKTDFVGTLSILDTSYSAIDPLENFSIRGTVFSPDPRTRLSFLFHGIYGKLLNIRRESDNFHQTLKIYVPTPDSKERIAYIFTQYPENPRKIVLNPEIIEKLEKNEDLMRK